MLAANITIGAIDYKRTFAGVFPLLRESISWDSIPPMAARLLEQLGDDALPVGLDIMDRIPDKTKTELLVMLANAYSGKIRDAINTKLAENRYGRYIEIGKVFFIEQGDIVHIWLKDVQVDYQQLVTDLLPGVVAFFVKNLVGEELERKAIDLLWNDSSKQKVLEMAADALARYGVAIELKEIELMDNNLAPVLPDTLKPQTGLTDSMREQLIDALACYLKENVRK